MPNTRHEQALYPIDDTYPTSNDPDSEDETNNETKRERPETSNRATIVSNFNSIFTELLPAPIRVNPALNETPRTQPVLPPVLRL